MRIVYVDFDGTVTRSNMLHYLYAFKLQLYRETGRISFLLGALYVLASIPYLYVLQRMGAQFRDRAFYRQYRGLSAAQVNACADAFWKEKGDRHKNVPVLNLLREYRESGCPVIVVSGSIRPVIEAWNRRYGLADAILCTNLEVDAGGILTGRIAGAPLVNEEKAGAIRSYEAEQNLQVSERICLSDSHDDLPMLMCATGAVAVNPDKRLRRRAEAENWQILVCKSAR